MAGGTGNDTLLYRSAAEGGDVIQGCGAGRGDSDQVHFLGNAFGGLSGPIGSRCVAHADKLAQKADDRFIFRTTDKTL